MTTIHARRIKGERISLPEKEFKKLLAMAEELQDIKDYDKAMKRINSGKAEFVSLENVIKNLPRR